MALYQVLFCSHPEGCHCLVDCRHLLDCRHFVGCHHFVGCRHFSCHRLLLWQIRWFCNRLMGHHLGGLVVVVLVAVVAVVAILEVLSWVFRIYNMVVEGRL